MTKTLLLAFAFGVLCLGPAMRAAEAAPEGSAPGSAKQEDFAHYLTAHQDELHPFFSKNGADFVGRAVPLVMQWLGGMLLLVSAAGWVIDTLLSFGFATMCAPAFARWKRSFIFATGRLVLSLFLTVLLSLAVVLVAQVSHLVGVIIAAAVVFLLVRPLAQIAWILYLYRTNIGVSVVFYIALTILQGVIGCAICAPLMGIGASAQIVAFVDRVVTPKLQAEAKVSEQELAAVTPARDQAAAQVAQLRAEIDQAKAKAASLQDEIVKEKDSEPYLFSQAVKIHAQGDLVTAHDRLASLLARFPSGPLTGLVEGQLTQVNSELAAQKMEKKQATAAALKAAALARADLLARAAKGQVTLSEMRLALIGKTRQEVRALLGAPSEIASDRWGFRQLMIADPLTNQKSGLAIYFLEGSVQGVDYYNYGGSP